MSRDDFVAAVKAKRKGEVKELPKPPGEDKDDEIVELFPISLPYWRAFQILTTRRWYQNGYPYPLLLTEIDMARKVVFTPDCDGYHDRDLFFAAILAMDNTFVEIVSEQVKQQKEKAEKERERRSKRGR